MKLFVANAFVNENHFGNRAGVVLLFNASDYLSDDYMLSTAKKLAFSETVFCRRKSEMEFELRYFTPIAEVNLCGHATIAAFSVLRDENIISVGEYRAKTHAGTLKIILKIDSVFIEMPKGIVKRIFSEAEAEKLYDAFNLKSAYIAPAIVNTGLSDILLPVANLSELNGMKPNLKVMKTISAEYGVIGFHVFCFSNDEITAHCRNFAPLFGIDEECATGTSNAALTYYLYTLDLIDSHSECLFMQGEAMGMPSIIQSAFLSGKIFIGGKAKIL
ncbi:MAG: PhzF family phenazine biosynthesis protein [Clostridia bacterium]